MAVGVHSLAQLEKCSGFHFLVVIAHMHMTEGHTRTRHIWRSEDTWRADSSSHLSVDPVDSEGGTQTIEPVWQTLYQVTCLPAQEMHAYPHQVWSELAWWQQRSLSLSFNPGHRER